MRGIEKKTSVAYWIFTAFVVIGPIVAYNRITHTHTNPVGSQTGVDITAMVILGW
jgi:hypothetical protein